MSKENNTQGKLGTQLLRALVQSTAQDQVWLPPGKPRNARDDLATALLRAADEIEELTGRLKQAELDLHDEIVEQEDRLQIARANVERLKAVIIEAIALLEYANDMVKMSKMREAIGNLKAALGW